MRRSLFAATAAFLFVSLLGPACVYAKGKKAASGGHGGDVPVSGYVKRDGTYVAPHYRSAPDGNFYNNWSTKGNYNPHTGADGTRVTPPASSYVPYSYVPHVYTSPVYRGNHDYSRKSTPDAVVPKAPDTSPPSFLNYRPAQTAPAPPRLTAPVVPINSPDVSGLSYDDRQRMHMAENLQRLGYSVDWHDHTWSEMYEWETRIKEASNLKMQGLDVDWHQHTWSEMYDWETRMREAKNLKALGIDTEWHDHTWSEMYDWETRVKIAKNLQRLGVNVDWHNYTWMQMYDMERKARGR